MLLIYYLIQPMKIRSGTQVFLSQIIVRPKIPYMVMPKIYE
jgi:hypothetical protein